MTSDIDRHIRDAFRAEDEQLNAFLESEPNLFDQVASTFRGSSRFLVVISVVVSLVFMGVSIYCIVRFFQADSTKMMIAWAIGFMWASMAVAAMKIWYWMEMQRHQITREIKRVEIEIAALARRMGG